MLLFAFHRCFTRAPAGNLFLTLPVIVQTFAFKKKKQAKVTDVKVKDDHLIISCKHCLTPLARAQIIQELVMTCNINNLELMFINNLVTMPL